MDPRSDISAEVIQGRIWGAGFMAGFGSLWLLLGFANTPQRPARLVWLSALTAMAIAGLGVALERIRKDLPSRPPSPHEEIRRRKVFTAVNIIQWVAAATAVVIMVLLHHQEYIFAAVGIIVGVHFYPLADVFRNPLLHVTGTAMLAWSAGCLALPQGMRLVSLSALGNGAILYGSALLSLAIVAFHAAAFRRTESASDLQSR